jgi:hypothetical protein
MNILDWLYFKCKEISKIIAGFDKREFSWLSFLWWNPPTRFQVFDLVWVLAFY